MQVAKYELEDGSSSCEEAAAAQLKELAVRGALEQEVATKDVVTGSKFITNVQERRKLNRNRNFMALVVV